MQARAKALEALYEAQGSAVFEQLPLFGVPFAVKDNIDVTGLPTTAACDSFGYTPDTSAFAVQRLIDAGAILIGKTNLDQFATGLVGTRSPYGAVRHTESPLRGVGWFECGLRGRGGAAGLRSVFRSAPTPRVRVACRRGSTVWSV